MNHWTAIFSEASAKLRPIENLARNLKRAYDVEDAEHAPKRVKTDDAGYSANIGIPRAQKEHDKENIQPGFVCKDATLPIRNSLTRDLYGCSTSQNQDSAE